jgi:hypothetical protein
MNSCVFVSTSGNSCMTNFELLNCAARSQPGSQYGTYGGFPGGGCRGLGNSAVPQEGLGIQFVLYLFHPSLRVGQIFDIQLPSILAPFFSSMLCFFVEITLLFIPVPTGVPHASFPFKESWILGEGVLDLSSFRLISRTSCVSATH